MDASEDGDAGDLRPLAGIKSIRRETRRKNKTKMKVHSRELITQRLNRIWKEREKWKE